jgi:hypothetical protein
MLINRDGSSKYLQIFECIVCPQTTPEMLPAGVDVMITIFCYFCQFSAKKLAFFSKTNV